MASRAWSSRSRACPPATEAEGGCLGCLWEGPGGPGTGVSGSQWLVRGRAGSLCQCFSCAVFCIERSVSPVTLRKAGARRPFTWWGLAEAGPCRPRGTGLPAGGAAGQGLDPGHWGVQAPSAYLAGPPHNAHFRSFWADISHCRPGERRSGRSGSPACGMDPPHQEPRRGWTCPDSRVYDQQPPAFFLRSCLPGLKMNILGKVCAPSSPRDNEGDREEAASRSHPSAPTVRGPPCCSLRPLLSTRPGLSPSLNN